MYIMMVVVMVLLRIWKKALLLLFQLSIVYIVVGNILRGVCLTAVVVS